MLASCNCFNRHFDGQWGSSDSHLGRVKLFCFLLTRQNWIWNESAHQLYVKGWYFNKVDQGESQSYKFHEDKIYLKHVVGSSSRVSRGDQVYFEFRPEALRSIFAQTSSNRLLAEATSWVRHMLSRFCWQSSACRSTLGKHYYF